MRLAAERRNVLQFPSEGHLKMVARHRLVEQQRRVDDLLRVLADWGGTGPCRDVDLARLLAAWGSCP